MTQIGVSKDRRPNSHFGGMREKSLRELKEQQLALCIEQVGTNAVPLDRAHCLLVRVSKTVARMMETTASVDLQNQRHASCAQGGGDFGAGTSE